MFQTILFLKTTALIIIFICFFFTIYSQTSQHSGDIIHWTNNSRLTFADFQGNPGKDDTASHEISAKTSTHKLAAVIKSINVHLETERGKTVFTIHAAMKKNLSWIKNLGDTTSLKHEQGHFDICEIYARILRRDIKKAKSLSEAKEMFEKILTEEELEHDNYDRENTFQSGGITKKWEDIITSRLKNLELYQNPIVKVPIDK